MWEEAAKIALELASALSDAIVSALKDDGALPHWMKLTAGGLSLIAALFSAYYWGRRVFREQVQKVFVDPETFWSKPASAADRRDYQRRIDASIPAIAIANYKGGVGKSMIAANLAAYYDKIGYRCLLIDYDYQGSLTDIVPYRNRNELTFSAHDVLKGEQQVRKPDELGRSFRGSAIHPAESELSSLDSELMFTFLMGSSNGDVRFNTRAYLSSAYVRDNFDIAIIDTPPRICTATANALCAATRVVMPTILDTVSSRAVFRSVEMFLNFRDRLGLGFKIFGVVPSKVETATGYNNRESQALAYLKDELHWKYKDRVNQYSRRAEPIPVWDDLPIMHKVGLLHIEGDDMVIFKNNPTQGEAVIQSMFAKLGNAILEDVGLLKMPPPSEPHENIRAA